MNGLFLPADKLLGVLRDHSVTRLYHANTVATASTFLKHKALLSRKTVSINGWPQTRQTSDELDRNFGIWNDIFLDTVDIHKRSHNRNFYGPVLFEIDINLLDSLSDAWQVRVTKKNPIHWHKREPLSERFFATVQEFRKKHTFGDFDKMIILRHNSGRLSLSTVLQSVIIDSPKITLQLDGIDYDPFDIARKVLRDSARESGLSRIKFTQRKCDDHCQCADQYRRFQNMSSCMFSPTVG